MSHSDKTTAGTSSYQLSSDRLLQTMLDLSVGRSVVLTHGTGATTVSQSVAGVFWARTVHGKPLVNATEITQTSHHRQ